MRTTWCWPLAAPASARWNARRERCSRSTPAISIPAFIVNTCPNGVVLFTGIPKGGGETRLFRMNSDGSGITQLTSSGIARIPFCSPDSQTAYFNLRDRRRGRRHYFLVCAAIRRDSAPGAKWISKASCFVLSPDAKLAMVGNSATWIRSSGRLSMSRPGKFSISSRLDMSALGMMSFSGDGKGIVRKVNLNGGNALQYQPIDGSPTHLLLGPTPRN